MANSTKILVGRSAVTIDKIGFVLSFAVEAISGQFLPTGPNRSLGGFRAAAILVDEFDAGHFECPTNGSESRATIDLAFSQSLSRDQSASHPNPEK